MTQNRLIDAIEVACPGLKPTGPVRHMANRLPRLGIRVAKVRSFPTDNPVVTAAARWVSKCSISRSAYKGRDLHRHPRACTPDQRTQGCTGHRFIDAVLALIEEHHHRHNGHRLRHGPNRKIVSSVMALSPGRFEATADIANTSDPLNTPATLTCHVRNQGLLISPDAILKRGRRDSMA